MTKHLPTPSTGLRWAQIAPPGTWTAAAVAETAADIARESSDSGPLLGFGGFGPGCIRGIPCSILARTSWGEPVRPAPLTGEARTWGGRDLYILRDGAIYVAVPKGRPSVFAGEMQGIRLTGAFRLVSAPRPGADYDRDVSRVIVVGAAGPVPARRLQAMDLASALARYGYTDPAVFADGAAVAVPAHLGGRE